ncbi:MULTISPECIES: DUF6321 domain-containing protein [Bradyrhizobium]|uniref:DUF6321 domain-containing protein n=1 Tax=Bradyrhizobium TaxID=374 RepID=UPI00211DAD09|nr:MULTISPECIES: DUF6321 domain-containing protein [Bradyrhizobium]
MTPHGKNSTRSLETRQSPQTDREGFQASQPRAEIGGESARPPRRPPLSQPRGQHAHGSKEDLQEEGLEESFEIEILDSKEDFREEDPQTHREEGQVSQAQRIRAREGSARRLTAAGRKAFARKQGADLRPGVTKKESEMTPQEMRRKGSWAVRFYGRAKLPPLVDARGRPTRHALSAHAWGEPVPKTVAAARRIAAKGERLLARYRRAKSGG